MQGAIVLRIISEVESMPYLLHLLHLVETTLTYNCTVQEFGKVRMFLAIQKDVQQMTTEESDAKKQVLKNLEEEVKQKAESVRLLSKGNYHQRCSL